MTGEINQRLFKKTAIFCSVETGMNLWNSLPNHENRNVYDGTPPQGLSEARRAGCFNCLLLIRRGGDPSGAAAIIVNGGL